MDNKRKKLNVKLKGKMCISDQQRKDIRKKRTTKLEELNMLVETESSKSYLMNV